jgi:hypothetical protein
MLIRDRRSSARFRLTYQRIFMLRPGRPLEPGSEVDTGARGGPLPSEASADRGDGDNGDSCLLSSCICETPFRAKETPLLRPHGLRGPSGPPVSRLNLSGTNDWKWLSKAHMLALGIKTSGVERTSHGNHRHSCSRTSPSRWRRILVPRQTGMTERLESRDR